MCAWRGSAAGQPSREPLGRGRSGPPPPSDGISPGASGTAGKDVGLVDLGQPSHLSSGRAWWSVAAQDRNQQRKQRLDLAAEHATLLSAFSREFGVWQRVFLASSFGPLASSLR